MGAVAVIDGPIGADLADGISTLGHRVTRVPGNADGLPSGLDAVVDATLALPQSRALADTAEPDWVTAVEEPLGASRRRLVAAMHTLRGRGGSVVVLVPTVSLTGATGFVPWVTVNEGRRALVKVAARAWGSLGITVNAVAVPGALLGGPSPDRPGLPAPALGTLPSVADVAAVISALMALPTVTGATVAVDGGVWMTP